MLFLRGREFLGPGVPRDVSFDEAARQIEAHGSAPILLVSKAGNDARAAGLLRQALGPGDIAVLVHTSQSPTRQLLLSLCLAQLASSDLGLAPAILDALDSQVSTRAVVTSVSRLSSPAPSLSQHLRSLLPGSMFAIDTGSKRVASVSSPEWQPVTPRTIGAWCMGSKAGRLTSGLAETGLPQITAPTGVMPWGASAWAEMSTLAEAPDALVSRLSSAVGSWWCPHCSRRVAGRGCLFCGTILPEAPRPNITLPASIPPRQARKEHS